MRRFGSVASEWPRVSLKDALVNSTGAHHASGGNGHLEAQYDISYLPRLSSNPVRSGFQLMMQVFRNAAKPVVFILTITFLAWMIVDLSGITGSGGLFTKTSVGSINGNSVDYRAYQEAVDQATQYQQQAGVSTSSMQVSEQIRDQVWEQFIQNAVMEDEYRRRHLTTNTAEIANAIRYNPPQELISNPQFQSGGNFDPAKYQAWLTSSEAAAAMPYLEQEYRDQILRSKLYSTVVADVFLSKAALWERWRYQTEAVKVNLTSIVPRTAVPDSMVPVTDAEIAEYYKSHPDDFRRKETAFLSYVSVPRHLDASDSAAALARARALRAEIEGGVAFAEVARRESVDRSSNQNGGDLGTVQKGSYGEDFDQAVFSLPLNTLSQPILTPMGYHLMEVTQRWTDSAKVKHILIPLELAGAHRDIVDAQADELQRLAADRLDPSALDTVAREMKLPIGRSAPVPEGTGVLIGNYLIVDAGIWAFRAKKGETSPIIESEEAFYVFRLDSLQAPGLPPLAEVRDAAERLVRDQKREVQALKLGEELIRRLSQGVSLEEASKALSLPNRDFGPFARTTPPVPSAKLIGAMFGVPVGGTSKLIQTPQGVYVFKVLDHAKADSTVFLTQFAQFQAQQTQLMRQERVREFEKALRQAARIKDERASFYNTTQAQTEAAGTGSIPGNP